ncbi:MAG: 30S ribosomal protein S7, partial [Eubacteriales bacterium]|nr:30S ribosomal protein S7 [Eubacteriales bacterium]
MPRRKGNFGRKVLPDPKYKSVLVAKFINQVMLDGKKSLAQSLVYSAFDIIANKTGADALEVFTQAVENVKPVLETKGRRVGGATYQVPMEIRPERRQTLAIRWIVDFARNRNGERNMDEKLAGELLDAYNNTGASIKRRDEMHRMAEANKAFAH